MKTRISIALLLALSFSAFNKPAAMQESKEIISCSPLAEYCSMYGVTSLTKNGQAVTVDPSALLYFCSENNFTIYTHSYAAHGTWVDNGKNITISVSAPSPEMDWVDGSWQVLERSDWTLEMEQVENGDVWRVRLEGRQR